MFSQQAEKLHLKPFRLRKYIFDTVSWIPMLEKALQKTFQANPTMEVPLNTLQHLNPIDFGTLTGKICCFLHDEGSSANMCL